MDTTAYAPGLSGYQDALEALRAEGRFRQCREVRPDSAEPMRISLDGRSAINFSSNDYLGLSQDARLKTASIAAIETYGTGSSASRLISGTSPLAVELEAAVAQFKQTEAALVFNSGYQANVAILQAILESGDWVFCDKLNHASLIDGCLLSGARWTRYRHLDLDALANKLKRAPSDARKWIVTDSLFSMDGDFPDLLALVDLADAHNAFILVDEAHATGLYGAKRRSGLCEQFGVSQRIALQMGTFSKALGGSGAYVAGSRVLIDTLINKARGFIYSTAQSPAVLAAALRAIQLVQADPTPTQSLWENVSHFQNALAPENSRVSESTSYSGPPVHDTEQASHAEQTSTAHRIPFPLRSPIVPVQLGATEQAIQLSQTLLDAGFFVQAIRPPTVPPNTSRLRIALSAAHTKEQLTQLAAALTQGLQNLD
jgi:8-amino-7-oxononanoate synthase